MLNTSILSFRSLGDLAMDVPKHSVSVGIAFGATACRELRQVGDGDLRQLDQAKV
jgi:hypothetical protein